MFANRKTQWILTGIVLLAVALIFSGSMLAQDTPGDDLDEKVYLPIVANETGSDDSGNTDPSPTPDPTDTSKWKTYTDDVAGFSFQYPGDWKIGWGASEGYSVMMLPAYETRYRAISIVLSEVVGADVETVSAASAETFESTEVQMFADSYGKQGIEGINASATQLGQHRAVELSNIPFVVGYHSQIIFYEGDYRYAVTLSQGGHHEGVPSYDDPLAQEDLQLMRKIVANMQFAD